MSTEIYRFRLPDGTEMATGLLAPSASDRLLEAAYPVYDEKFYLDKADIEKALKGDVYKTFRRLRSPWIINQANLGKCNASATVAALHNRRSLDGLPHVVLSDCHLYSRINGGRDQGSLLTDGLAASKLGIAPRKLRVNGTDALYPANVYNQRQVSAALWKAASEASAGYTTHEAYRLPSENLEVFKIALASALARDHQVIHAWHVGNASMNLRNGYVVVGRGPGNHATLFHSAKWVGGQDLIHPDMQNSWGPSKDAMYGPPGANGFGEDGFGLFTLQDAYACVRYHQYWVLPGNTIKDAGIK